MLDFATQSTASHGLAHRTLHRQDVMKALAAKAPVCSGQKILPPNTALWNEGDERTHVFIVKSGALCFSRMLPDGRRIVLGFAYPDDTIGLDSDIRHCDAHAMQTTRLIAIPISAYNRAVNEDPDFQRQATAAMSDALNEAYRHVVVISKLSAPERLASFLVALSERNQAHGLSPLSVVLPMKRLDIADFLGLTIETVSRTFTQFKAVGLIAMDQSNIVIFKNIQKLRALAAGEGTDV